MRDSNTLELIWTSEPAMVDKLEVREHFSNSDHNVNYGIKFDLVCKIRVTETVRIKNVFNKEKWDEMRQGLEDISWVDLIRKDDVNIMYEKFCDILTEKKPINLYAFA